MSEPLEPLSDAERRVIAAGRDFLVPAGAEQRVFSALQASLAVAGSAAAASAASSAVPATAKVALSAKVVTAVAAASVLVGVGSGVALDRVVLRPERPAPAPTVIERIVRVEVPTPSPTPPAPEVKVVAPARKPESPAPKPVSPEPLPAPLAADALLARERELIDTARSALLHGDASASLEKLQLHAASFPKGRLDEERESLWVQALLMKGDVTAARARADAFHRAFPNSLLGPAVDAAFDEP